MSNSWNTPGLTKPIQEDVPHMQEKLTALLKQDPSSIADVPVGAKRLVEISTGHWKIQQFDGESWQPLPGMLDHNVHAVDGYHAAITPNANTIAVRGEDKKLPGDITGNAATATVAATLSDTLPVEKGGTGATTSAEARNNLGAAPTSHTSPSGTYGLATDELYGHVRSDGTTTLVAAGEIVVKDVAIGGDTADTASGRGQIGDVLKNHEFDDFNDVVSSGIYYVWGTTLVNAANHPPTTAAGYLIVRGREGGSQVVQTFIEVGSNTTYIRCAASSTTWLDWVRVITEANTATTSAYGITKLSSAVNSTSEGLAATSKAVKLAYDKAAAIGIATSTKAGISKPSTGLTITEDGAMSVLLNNTVTSTSSTQAATANAVKTAYDKAVDAYNKANSATAKAYITTTWHSGANWYRKWSDGFIEQGGYTQLSTVAPTRYDDLTLLTPFTTNQYSFVAVPESLDDSFYVNDSVSFLRTNKTKSSIRIVSEQTGDYYICWYACGY